MCVRNGDGVDFGLTTGEPFQHFAYWAVSRHPDGQFADHDVMQLLRNEFPYRNDERKWPNAKRRTFQSISAYRSYARDGRKLGIRNEAERAEVLSRIDAKMRVMPKNRSVAGQLLKEEERDEPDLALGRSHPVIRLALPHPTSEVTQSLCVGSEVGSACVPRRLILSKKGFDTSNGKVPSPILPSGSMFSLPIPFGFGPTTYSDVSWTLDDRPLTDLVEKLTNARISRQHVCHLDPDLRFESLPRKPGWRPAFGQHDTSQGHLKNNHVCPGDLFLFYGLFCAVEWRSGHWAHVASGPWLHVIFGWLQVDEVVVVSSANVKKILADKPWLEDHPHMHDLDEWRFENAIYVAREWLSCEPEHGGDERVPGAGTFAFDRDLVLTAPTEQFRGGHFYYWSLFPWCGELRNARFSRISSPEYLVDRATLNTHTGYGQELVIDQCDYPDAIRWALGLVRRFGQPAGGR